MFYKPFAQNSLMMVMFESAMKSRIRKAFPGWEVAGMEAISRNPARGPMESVTYSVVIGKGGCAKRVFAKRFGRPFISRHGRDIEETVRLSRMEELHAPDVLAYFRDMHCLLMERAEGRDLFSLIARSPLAAAGFGDGISHYARGVARCIACMQSTTAKGKERLEYVFGDYRYKAVEGHVKDVQRLRLLVDSVQGFGCRQARSYSDLKVGHVIANSGDFRIIDSFPFAYNLSFINPVAFVVSLELAQRVPYFRPAVFRSLRRDFYEEYARAVPWKVDMEFMERMELLKKCELLAYFRSVSGTSMKALRRLSNVLDVGYLRKSVNRGLESL